MWGVSDITDLSHLSIVKWNLIVVLIGISWMGMDVVFLSHLQLSCGEFFVYISTLYLIALFGFPIFCPYALVFNNLIGSDFMTFILLLTHISLFVFYWETEQELIQMREEGGRTGRRRGPGNHNKYNIWEENIYFIKMTKKKCLFVSFCKISKLFVKHSF